MAMQMSSYQQSNGPTAAGMCVCTMYMCMWLWGAWYLCVMLGVLKLELELYFSSCMTIMRPKHVPHSQHPANLSYTSQPLSAIFHLHNKDINDPYKEGLCTSI